MKIKKIISAFLALMLLAAAFILPVNAEDEVLIENYYSTAYKAQADKVAKMQLMYTSSEFGYAMYFDKLSGEFALKNLKTGEITFSNPYDVAVDASTTEAQRNALMSQVILSYSGVESGTMYVLNSFAGAAMKGNQITFKTLSDGVRVEYAIGTVESKRLIPRQIEKTRFTEQIYNVMKERYSEMTKDEKFIFDHLLDTYYKEIDQTLEDNQISGLTATWRETYKCLENNHEMIIYIMSQSDNRSLRNIETLIRKFCPNYTYDELEYDHDLTMYEGDEAEPALFRLAIEYKFDEYGFSASIPSKSIRYNETNYSLESISLLPYFGCTSVKTTGVIDRTGGYIFIPDGSGTLLEYYNEDGTVKKGNQGSPIYGSDYTYEELSMTTANQETYRMPVFGLTENYTETVTTERSGRSAKTDYIDHKRGFLAIISEGESFATIYAVLGSVTGVTDIPGSGGGPCEYDYVYAGFSTKQSDTVSLGSSLGSDKSLSTSVDTKYLGNYTIRYMLLTDPVTAEEKGIDDYYYPSYIGMADAYRDYLTSSGEMKKLATDEIESSVPLYIQSFGYTTVQETFLTFPVSVKKPLTTFEDIQKMCESLKENNITNLRFILREYGNVITKAKFPGVDGGNSGFKKLMNYANENGILIFPDYDFANVTYQDMRAGFSLKKYGAQTMSGRYTTKRDYDFIFQMMNKFGNMNVVSPVAFETIYNKFSKSFNKFKTNAISALTLGTDLNSDFNEDNPITREDSKYYTIELLKQIGKDNANILVSSGNSYVLPYVTDIVDISLDNSRYSISSASVPFVGMVLHGYVNYAGTAINMSGDVQYEILKSLENGAAPYFILSYENTSVMKDSYDLVEYYSVDFTRWLPDVIKHYNTLNSAIGDMQSATITSHNFEKAFRLDEETAGAMFGTYNNLKAALDKASIEYDDAIKAVDRLIADQKDPTSAIAVEAAKFAALNKAKNAFKLYEQTFERYLSSNVVSVTYTAASGKTKTFYINYNTFDVVLEGKDGGVFTIPSESFVEKSDVKETNKNIKSVELATAYKPTTSNLANYKTASANLLAAEESGNEAQITRYKAALDNIISGITVQENVLCVTDASGHKIYINTTTDSVLVKTGDYSYITIAGQSYTLTEQ